MRFKITESERYEIRKKYNLRENYEDIQVQNGHIVLRGYTYKLTATKLMLTFDITVLKLMPKQDGSFDITYIHPVNKQEETKPIKKEKIDFILQNVGKAEIDLGQGKKLVKI